MIKRALLIIILLRILRRLTQPFEKWPAYKAGIIDKTGNILKNPSTKLERKKFDAFDWFLLRFRKVIRKYIPPALLRTELLMLFIYVLKPPKVNAWMKESIEYTNKFERFEKFNKDISVLYEDCSDIEKFEELVMEDAETFFDRALEESNLSNEEIIGLILKHYKI